MTVKYRIGKNGETVYTGSIVAYMSSYEKPGVIVKTSANKLVWIDLRDVIEVA